MMPNGSCHLHSTEGSDQRSVCCCWLSRGFITGKQACAVLCCHALARCQKATFERKSLSIHIAPWIECQQLIFEPSIPPVTQCLGAGHACGGGSQVRGVAGVRVRRVGGLPRNRRSTQGSREVGHVRPRVGGLPRVGVLPLPQRQLLKLRCQALHHQTSGEDVKWGHVTVRTAGQLNPTGDSRELPGSSSAFHTLLLCGSPPPTHPRQQVECMHLKGQALVLKVVTQRLRSQSV